MPVLGSGGGFAVVASGRTSRSINQGTTLDITISAVDLTKAFVVSSTGTGISYYWPGYPNNTPAQVTPYTATVGLTSSTNVRIELGQGYGNQLTTPATVNWYVVEQQ